MRASKPRSEQNSSIRKALLGMVVKMSNRKTSLVLNPATTFLSSHLSAEAVLNTHCRVLKTKPGERRQILLRYSIGFGVRNCLYICRLGTEPLEKAITRNIRFDHALVSSNLLPSPSSKAKGTANPYHQGPAWQLLAVVAINRYIG